MPSVELEPERPGSHEADRWPLASFLVVEDEPWLQAFLRTTLEPRAARVACAGGSLEARALLREQAFDFIVLDISGPDDGGLALLSELRAARLHCEVIVTTACADLDLAVEALRAGASDFLLKPFGVTQLLNAVGRAAERAPARRDHRELQRTLSPRQRAVDGLVGSSIAIKGLQAALARLADVHSTVLLTGETGTGKELAAHALHRLGPRAAAPFVRINCSSLAPGATEAGLFGEAERYGSSAPGRGDGLFRHADGGTLFLDEIGGLAMPLQAAFLHALEHRHVRTPGAGHERPADVRIVAASSVPLADEVAAGRFRADLYYRLHVVELNLPALRAHKEDIPALAAHFIVMLSAQLRTAPISISAEEMAFLMQYDWPGNVRELRNLIERSLIMGALDVSTLYTGLDRDAAARRRAEPPHRELEDLPTMERRHILAVLDSVRGNKSRAAQLLGISRRTLERRAAEWGL